MRTQYECFVQYGVIERDFSARKFVGIYFPFRSVSFGNGRIQDFLRSFFLLFHFFLIFRSAVIGSILFCVWIIAVNFFIIIKGIIVSGIILIFGIINYFFHRIKHSARIVNIGKKYVLWLGSAESKHYI